VDPLERLPFVDATPNVHSMAWLPHEVLNDLLLALLELE
jgi:hypothetical protein